MSYFIQDTNALGVDAIYVQNSTEHEIRVVKQDDRSKTIQREVNGDAMSDNNIFLIELPFSPKKNDKIKIDTATHYVYDWEIVTATSYRVTTKAGQEIIPMPNKRLSL